MSRSRTSEWSAGLWRAWCDYWFRPTALARLAVCRALIVGFQLFHLLTHDYPATLQQLAALPDSQYEPLLILRLLTWPGGWHYRPSYEVLLAVYGVSLGAGALALVGLGTNLSLLLFAAGNIFLGAFVYSFGEFHHPEAVLMIALVLLALSPSGGALSVDRLWRQRRLRGGAEGSRPLETAEVSPFARWPLLVIGWLIALAYLSAAGSKLADAGPAWLNGYTLQHHLLRDGLLWGSELGVWLGQQHTLAWLLSWMTILFESTFFLAVLFPRLRWLYVPAGLLLHLGIYLTMSAPFFQFMVLYSVLVPWETVWQAVRSQGRRPGGGRVAPGGESRPAGLQAWGEESPCPAGAEEGA